MSVITVPPRALSCALLAILLLLEGSVGFQISQRRLLRQKIRTVSFSAQRTLKHHVSNPSSAGARLTTHQPWHTSLQMLRGGGDLVAGLSAPLTAKLCSGFLTINGLALLFAPVLWTDSLYYTGIEEGTFEVYLLRAIGAISVGMGVNVYLTVLQNMSVERAMGFALLPRLLFLLLSFLLKKYDSLAVGKQFLSVNTAIMSWTTFSLLSGVGNPVVAAKVFSSLAVLKGALLTIRPNIGAKKFFALDISSKEKDQARALSKALGNYLVASAVLMALLAFGVNSVRAAGYTALLFSVLLLDLGFVSKTWKWMSETSPWAQLMHCFIALGFAAGFLL